MLKVQLQQIGLDRIRTCVELGCGAGRLTNALARDFAVVHAHEVSPHRLEMARRVPHSSNVEFRILEKPVIPLADATCDLCVSTHVLQHVPDMRVVENYLREMCRVLRPGAFAGIHVPVIGAHGMTGNLSEVMLRRGKEITKQAFLALTRQVMRARGRRLPWKIDQYHVFSFVRLDGVLRQHGFSSAELRILPWAGGHAYVFARK